MKFNTAIICFAISVLLTPVIANAGPKPPPSKAATAHTKAKTSHGVKRDAPKRTKGRSATRKKAMAARNQANRTLAEQKGRKHPERRKAGNWGTRFRQWLNNRGRKPVYNKSLNLSDTSIPPDAAGRRPLPPRGRLSLYYASTTAQAGDIYDVERPRRDNR